MPLPLSPHTQSSACPPTHSCPNGSDSVRIAFNSPLGACGHVLVFFSRPGAQCEPSVTSVCVPISLPQFQLQMFDIVCSLGWTSRDKCCDIPAMVSRDCIWIVILRGVFLNSFELSSTVWSVHWKLLVKAHFTCAEKIKLSFADFKRCL